MYRMSGKTVDGGFKKELYKFIPGMKIFVADNKSKYSASLDEGKRAMSFEVYKILCEELHNGKGDDHLFVHAFLTME